MESSAKQTEDGDTNCSEPQHSCSGGSTSSMTNRTSNADHRSLGCVKMLSHLTALTSLLYTGHQTPRVREVAAKVTPNLRTLKLLKFELYVHPRST